MPKYFTTGCLIKSKRLRRNWAKAVWTHENHLPVAFVAAAGFFSVPVEDLGAGV
jgi:hypothetical protein